MVQVESHKTGYGVSPIDGIDHRLEKDRNRMLSLRPRPNRALPAPFDVQSLHCSSCRRMHAAAFVTWTAFAEKDVRIRNGSEELREYASSPGVRRKFCSQCGTHIVYSALDQPGKIYVPRACIEGAFDREPECHVNVSDQVD